MRVGTTNTGKKFVFDRARFVAEVNGFKYFVTASTLTIVRENDDGTFTEITRAVAEANILLLPYDLAKELFPANANLVETI